MEKQRTKIVNTNWKKTKEISSYGHSYRYNMFRTIILRMMNLPINSKVNNKLEFKILKKYKDIADFSEELKKEFDEEYVS